MDGRQRKAVILAHEQLAARGQEGRFLENLYLSQPPTLGHENIIYLQNLVLLFLDFYVQNKNQSGREHVQIFVNPN